MSISLYRDMKRVANSVHGTQVFLPAAVMSGWNNQTRGRSSFWAAVENMAASPPTELTLYVNINVYYEPLKTTMADYFQ